MTLDAKQAVLKQLMEMLQKGDLDKLRGPAKVDLEMTATPDPKTAESSEEEKAEESQEPESQPTSIMSSGHADAAKSEDHEDPALLQQLLEKYSHLA